MKKVVVMLLFSFSLFAEEPGIVKNTKVSFDPKMNVIKVEWENLGYNSYTVFRSDKVDSDFNQIALVENAVIYEDSNIEKGVKYWYKIIPASEDSVTVSEEKYISEEDYISFLIPDEVKKREIKSAEKNTAEKNTAEKNTEKDVLIEPNYSAYSSKPIPSGLSLNKLIAEKKNTLQSPKDPEQLNIFNRRLDYLKKYYMNSIKLSLAMGFSRQYVNSGELRIFDKFMNYELKEGERKIVFFGESYDYVVEFESKKLFSILNGSEDEDLKELLLKNAETFCLYSGEKAYVDKDGKTRYIHTFDAVGLSTRYLKNDKDWKKKTIMVSTSRKDLQQKLQNAQRR